MGSDEVPIWNPSWYLIDEPIANELPDEALGTHRDTKDTRLSFKSECYKKSYCHALEVNPLSCLVI